ncbi:YbaN family protein [Isobaculum melis]|uniref:DUF454 domain-containing protein n=1 Tax=Isobaculum melis TaxID=142588 RepID=A0A1H9TSZ5_9LACT|nr:YbaN family protein [Isobaculum melis]SES00206.1 hypothetical protein SAMN04488559_11613 [Isobaculum melis]
MKKYLYIGLGFLSFGLGTIGLFLPILPTTPLYLLTAFLWLRSSETLHQKFIQSDKYKKYVGDPLVKKKMTNKGMVKMFVMMLIVFAIPGILVDNTIMRISLVVVYLAHLIFLTWYLRRKDKVKVGEAE